MRRFVFACVFLIGSTWVFGQRFSSEVFHDGFLVSTERDTLKGDLRYDMDANILTLIFKGRTYTFSSHKVFYFEIFDEILNNYRQFYSIPYNVSYDYKIPVFFELVYEGKVSLMAREQIVSQVVNNSAAYWGGGNVSQLVVRYSYYFMETDGTITYFSGRKKDLLDFMVRKASDVKRFIKDNGLETDEMADLVRITAFYNSI